MNCFADHNHLVRLLETKQRGLSTLYLNRIKLLFQGCFGRDVLGNSVQAQDAYFMNSTIYIYSSHAVPNYDIDNANVSQIQAWINGIQSFLTVTDGAVRSVWNVCKEQTSEQRMSNLLRFMLRNNADKNIYLMVDLKNITFAPAFDLYARFGFDVVYENDRPRIENETQIRMQKIMSLNETRSSEEAKAYRYKIISQLVRANSQLIIGNVNPRYRPNLSDARIVQQLNSLLGMKSARRHKTMHSLKKRNLKKRTTHKRIIHNRR